MISNSSSPAGFRTLTTSPALVSSMARAKGDIQLADSVFNAAINQQVMYLVLKSYRANQRQGLSSSPLTAERTASSATTRHSSQSAARSRAA